MVKSPRTPFPSFTLVLSRQAAGDHNESNIDTQEIITSNAEPSIDLMVSRERVNMSRIAC